MYREGLAVDKNLEKGEQLLALAAQRGDPVAMLTLAEILFGKNEFEMAKLWYDRACESGNVVAQQNRDEFTKKLEAGQQYSSMELNAIKTANNYINSFQAKISPSVASERSYMKDYDMLKEHANRGSITAERLCAALDHFAKALNMLLHYDSFTEEQEEMFIHELSQCFRIETIVAQIPCPMHKRVTQIIKKVLDRCTKESNSVALQIDEDVRLCYATLHLNSDQLIDQFLGPCKQKYPKSMYFFLVSGVANGFLRRPEHGLYNINCGLEIEPENYELLYHKAVLLRHIGKDMDEAIKAYQTFLRVAPKDHRKVPEVYYEMAICSMQGYTPDIAPNIPMNTVIKLYREGKEAEKLQLPCFLPYKSENIAFIKPVVDILELEQNTESVVPVNNRNQCLTHGCQTS
jgi:tetratricopeptide (TPR) repeat protein